MTSRGDRATTAATLAARLLGAAIALAGCNRAPIPASPPLPVTVSTAQSASGGAGNSYSANIVAETQVDLAFKVNGYVQSILQAKGPDGRVRNIQAGDAVAAGAVLATIKEDTYRQKYLQAQSELVNANAINAKAKADFSRYQRLYEQHVVAKADYDAARQQSESATASIAAAQAAVRQARIDLDDCRLKSPMNGLVLERKIEVGTLVAPNTVGFQIGDTAKVKVIFGVPGAIVAEMHQGSALSITTDAFPGQSFDGTITQVGAMADPNSRLFDIEATIPNPGARLRVGMIAALHLPGSAAQKALTVVPMRAIVRPPDDPQGFAVYVVENNPDGQSVAHLKTVTIGPVTGDQVTVEAGLEPGARVIVKGADLVSDRQVVSVVP